jgi:hypothetical protein
MDPTILENINMPKTFCPFLFFILIIPLNGHAFALNNSASLVFDHDEVTVNIADIACSNIGIDIYELKAIIGDAVNQYWNKSPTSRLKLRAGNIIAANANFGTDLICNASTNCVPNKALAVANNILITCNSNSANFTNPAILATTVPNNISGNTIVGSLVMLNDLTTNLFAIKSRDEKVSIIAHELGHAFGLAHSPVNDSLMFYKMVNMRKSLGADDIDGISYLYPKLQPINCGSVSTSNNPHSWLGLLLGLSLVIFFKKCQFRYLKLRPRV